MIHASLHPLLLVLLAALGAVGPAGLHGWMHVDSDHGQARHEPAEDCGGHDEDRLESRHGHELVGPDAHCAICLLVRQAPRVVSGRSVVLEVADTPARAPDLGEIAVHAVAIASPVGARAPPVCG